MELSKEISSNSSTLERVLAAAGVSAIAAGSFVVAYFNPVTAGFFPQCPSMTNTFSAPDAPSTEKPPNRLSGRVPGTVFKRLVKPGPFGSN